MNIKGKYCFNINFTNMFMNKTVIVYGSNLITRQGEARILNRLLSDEYDTLKYIVLGTSDVRPTKNDTTLGSFKNKKVPSIMIDLKNKGIVCTAEYTSQELENVSEIGLSTETVLITHDVFDEITVPSTSTTTLTYTLALETETVEKNWSYYQDNIYYCLCYNTVTSVYEENTLSGYHKKDSLDSLSSTGAYGSYYYESRNNRLYIRSLNDNNPNYYRIYVKTK